MQSWMENIVIWVAKNGVDDDLRIVSDSMW